MTLEAEKEYLAQFEVVPYSVDIKKIDSEWDELGPQRLKVVLQSRGWSKENASRVQVDSVTLISQSAISFDDAAEDGLNRGGQTTKPEIKAVFIERVMETDFDREVAVYEFELPITESLSDTPLEDSCEEGQYYLRKHLSSLLLKISYSIMDSKTKDEETFQSICLPTCISWRRVL